MLLIHMINRMFLRLHYTSRSYTSRFLLYLYIVIIFFFFFLMMRHPPRSPLFPYPTLFRSVFEQTRRRHEFLRFVSSEFGVERGAQGRTAGKDEEKRRHGDAEQEQIPASPHLRVS